MEAEEDAEAVAGGCGLLLVSGEVGMLRTGSITFLEECGDLDDDAEDVGGICFCSLEVGSRIGAGKGSLFIADVSVMVRPRGRWGYMLVMGTVCCDVCADCSCFCFFDGICDDDRVTGADRLYPEENISAADAFTVGAAAAAEDNDDDGFGFRKSLSDDFCCGGGGGGFTSGTVEAVT